MNFCRLYYYKEVFGKPPSGIKYEALKAANMSSTNMTRMVLLPPKRGGIDCTIQKGFRRLIARSGLSSRRDHAMRFQPRFEVGEAGERLFQLASQTRPEVISFLRDYIDQANR